MHESAEVRERRWAPGLEEQDQTVHHQPGVQLTLWFIRSFCFNRHESRRVGERMELHLDEQD
jgi:hypothetical protein